MPQPYNPADPYNPANPFRWCEKTITIGDTPETWRNQPTCEVGPTCQFTVTTVAETKDDKK